VADHPSPHLSGLFRAIASHPGLNLKVIFTRRENPLRSWGSHLGGYQHEFLPVYVCQWGDYVLKPGSLSLLRRIVQEHFDVLLISEAYFQPLTFLLISLAWLLGRKWTFLSEPPYRKKRNFVLMTYYQLMLKFLGKDLIFTPGHRGVEIFKDLVPKKCKLVNVPYYMNLQPYAEAGRLRQYRDHQDWIIFCFGGRFIKRKRVDLLLQALAAMPERKWRLLLVGSGPEESGLRSMVPQELAGRVLFLGEAPFADMPYYYALGDVFVYPSNDDGWGMAVPEALAAGMPVISTWEVSAAVDLIRPGENGFIVAPDSGPALQEAIRYFLDHPERLPEFSHKASRVVEHYNAAVIAGRFYDAIKNCLPLST
jgi:glycosyltransferase involved in cell wall biosynthesis